MSSSRTKRDVVPWVIHPNPLPPRSRLIIPDAWSCLCVDRNDRLKDIVPGIQRIDFGTDVSGLPLKTLLTCTPEALRETMADFDDQMILEVLVPHIEITIKWPGYDTDESKFTYKVRLSEPGGQGVSCKGELAMAVARAYDKFFKDAPSTINPAPTVYDAPFVINPNDPSQPYKIENLALVSLFLEKRDRPGVLHTTVELLDRRIPPGLAAFPLAYHPRQYGLIEAGAAETMSVQCPELLCSPRVKVRVASGSGEGAKCMLRSIQFPPMCRTRIPQ